MKPLIPISPGEPPRASEPAKPASFSLKREPQFPQKLRIPLAFEKVESLTGQTKFLGRGPGYELVLTPNRLMKNRRN